MWVSQQRAPSVAESQFSVTDNTEFDKLLREKTELIATIQKLAEEKKTAFKLNEMLIGKLRMVGLGSLAILFST